MSAKRSFGRRSTQSLNVETPNEQQLEMLVVRMEALVAVLGMVRLGGLEQDESVH